MSHWQVTAVAKAFSLQEKSGRGLENMTCKVHTIRASTWMESVCCHSQALWHRGQVVEPFRKAKMSNCAHLFETSGDARCTMSTLPLHCCQVRLSFDLKFVK
jgi:hypothetical protein